MIDISTNRIIYISCFALITLVCIYFLLIWQIREIVNEEFTKKMNNLESEKMKNKKKKLMYLKHKNRAIQNNLIRKHKIDQTQSLGSFEDLSENMSEYLNNEADMDSYIDPAEGYSGKNNQSDQTNEIDSSKVLYGNERLNKNDIMTRDMVDGIR